MKKRRSARGRMKMSVVQGIRALRELFGPNGEQWTQFTALDSYGNRCLIGGLEAVLGEEGGVMPLEETALGRLICSEAGIRAYNPIRDQDDEEPRWESIPDFNDAVEWREIDKVLARAQSRAEAKALRRREREGREKPIPTEVLAEHDPAPAEQAQELETVKA